MAIKAILSVILICLGISRVRAGDAVAMGYNWAGVWTAVTYSRSLTPKGGPHYHEAAQAGAMAVRDLQRRASEDLVRTKVISQSDRTGYVTVARGRPPVTLKEGLVDVTAIGRGRTQAEADKNAFQKLADRSATDGETIVYQYFSYGRDSAAPPRSPKSSVRFRPANPHPANQSSKSSA